MRSLTAAVIALCLAAPMAARAGAIEDLSWMAGCWVQDTGGKRIDETWLPPAGGVLLGVGRTVKAGKVTEYEYTRIEAVNGVPTYIAKPGGQAEASFAAVDQTPAQIVFENRAHDFPQRIIYRTLGPDRLQAAIEGPVKGKTVRIEFNYKRCS